MSRLGQRIIAAMVLLSVMTMSTACYGPFNSYEKCLSLEQ